MILALFAGFASAASTLSLEEAIRLAVERNPNVDQAELQLQIASVQETRARLDRFGAVVGAQAGASERVYVPLDGGSTYDQQLADWDVRATGTVPLYQGGAVNARIDQASASQRISSVDQTLSQRDVARAVVVAYWNIQGFELQLQAAREALDVTRESLQVIEARAASGLAAPIDVNRSRVDVLSQETQLLNLENARYNAVQELARLLSTPDDQITLTDPIPELPAGDPVPPTVDADGSDRLELRRLEHTSEQASAGIRLARSAALPSVSVIGDVGLGATAAGAQIPGVEPVNLDPADLAPTLDAGIALGVTWTPFDLFRTRQNVEVATLARQQVDAQTRAQQDRVRQEIRSATEQLHILRRQAAAVGEQLRLARENVDIIQTLYGQGNTTILELFQAQSQFRAARTQAASLMVDLVNAEWDLRWALGTDPITTEGTP